MATLTKKQQESIKTAMIYYATYREKLALACSNGEDTKWEIWQEFYKEKLEEAGIDPNLMD